MNTAEHFNTSTDIMVDVQDVDDQYPQFLPCTLLFQDRTNRICTSPVYTVNVTEGKEVGCSLASAFCNFGLGCSGPSPGRVDKGPVRIITGSKRLPNVILLILSSVVTSHNGQTQT